MARLFGYHLIWTTYGTWLQGDKRGYVKNGQKLDANEPLFELCKKLQTDPEFRLQNHEKKIVETAITDEAERISHIIHALAVHSNHVHIAARTCDRSIETVVSMYKSAGTRALRHIGRTGKIWTAGFYKTFCFTPEEFAVRVKYIQKHNI
jgi:REP element-mobilizing transposase RayT